jgi:hypothetical protein
MFVQHFTTNGRYVFAKYFEPGEGYNPMVCKVLGTHNIFDLDNACNSYGYKSYSQKTYNCNHWVKGVLLNLGYSSDIMDDCE